MAKSDFFLEFISAFFDGVDSAETADKKAIAADASLKVKLIELMLEDWKAAQEEANSWTGLIRGERAQERADNKLEAIKKAINDLA